LCSSLADDNCSVLKTVAGLPVAAFAAILQPCRSVEELDCVSELGSVSADGSLARASFVGNFPSVGRHDFKGDEKLKLPNGGAPTLWSMPNAAHAGGATYMLQVESKGQLYGSEFVTTEFNVELQPIELVGDECLPGVGSDLLCETNQGLGFYNFYGKPGLASRVSSLPYDCVVIAEDQCARRHAFPVDSRFSLTLRLSQSPKGWLHGRLSKPTVSMKALSGSAVELKVIASTVATPIVATSTAWSDLPPALQDAYRLTGGFNGASAGTRNRETFTSGPEIRNAISKPAPYSKTGMAEARCIYGFSKAPLNATISIVDDEGVKTAATKLVSESDGWIRIAAYGFGFSSPKIRVLFTQDAVKNTGTSASKKVTITCKKNKLVKKFSGVKPKCPKGFTKTKTIRG